MIKVGEGRPWAEGPKRLISISIKNRWAELRDRASRHPWDGKTIAHSCFKLSAFILRLLLVNFLVYPSPDPNIPPFPRREGGWGLGQPRREDTGKPCVTLPFDLTWPVLGYNITAWREK